MILVVDHYDSFTFNLVQLIESLGRETRVVRSDERPTAELLAMRPEAVVLSPGPGHPRDVGIFTELLAELPAETPVLGVCLGHQALGIGSGGTVDRTDPVHGKASLVFHEGQGILAGVPVPFEAGRYHSLVVERSLPPALELTAWTEDGLVMGAQHRELPRYGVQFHPESILLPRGPGSWRTSSAYGPEGGAGQPGPYAKAADPLATRHVRSSTAANALAGIRFS